jgi:Tetratricopeptide repeat
VGLLAGHDGLMTKLARGLLAVVIGVIAAGVFAVAGTWRGGLAGGALIGMGVYVAPAISDYLSRRRARAEATRERLERVSASATIPVPLSEPGPAALLRADRQVVGFIDRPELERLRGWCDNGGQQRVLLLTGAGGVGKTRLALQLAREKEAAGWVCRVVRPGEEADSVRAVRAVSSGPVLLVIDYAETRSGLAGVLRAAAGDGAGQLRVLLLARSLGEWWGQLEASIDATVRSIARAAAQVRLPPLPIEVASASDVFRLAVAAFAGALDVPVPERVELAAPGIPVPILVLHAAALLAVLESLDQHQPGPPPVTADDRVLDDLLAREAAFWLGAAQAANLAGPGGIDSVLAAQAVTVGCLFAAADEADAADLLRRVPGLADSQSAIRRRIARWLQQLYPPASAVPPADWWGSLQPDLLSERHVVSQLAAARDLAEGCLRSLSGDQARRVLTILARACAHRSDAPGLLAAALRADLHGLAVPAVEVAVQTGGPLGKVLATVLSDTAARLETLITIQQAIPHPTVTLAAADAAVTERIARALPADTEPAERARWADALSTRLAQIGRSDQALAPAQEAVALYRELAASDPGRYRAALAAAVANLGVRLHRLGLPAEAAAMAREAVAARRELAQADPGQYLPDLAISLSNLSTDLAELGRPAEALTAIQEAAAIHQQLAQTRPGRYMPDLAASLVNLAATSGRLGRADEARAYAQESAAIYWRLASTHPDRFLPGLAISFTDLGALLADLGDPADALPAAQHAITLYRQLADISPDRYQPELANALTNLSTLLSETSHPDQALAQAEEAARILRDLAARAPGTRRADLATALSNLGISLAGLGRHAEALAPTEEAVAIYRDLAEASPDRYRPELATCVANLGLRLSDLGRHRQARTATLEAVTIYRGLAADQPDRYRPDLAAALSDLGLRFLATGTPAAALPVSGEAVRIYRELASASRSRYLPRLAIVLTYHGAILIRLGKATAALAADEEAVGIYQELAGTDPGRYQPERASALANLAGDLSAVGRPAEAVLHAEEAVRIYREAAQQNPGRFDLHLAASLETLARTLAMLDRAGEAAAAEAEATALREARKDCDKDGSDAV